MVDVDDALITGSDVILSVVPPSEALGLARRLASELERVGRKPEPGAKSPALYMSGSHAQDTIVLARVVSR
jgi:hypothetical protein